MIHKRVIITALFIYLTFTVVGLEAREGSSGYQLALVYEQKRNPEKVLTRQIIRPSDATVREFEWIIETLMRRCKDSESAIVGMLVQSWRTVQRRGYDVDLLEYSRELASFSNIAFQSYRNTKVDFEKVVAKWVKDKYPLKK